MPQTVRAILALALELVFLLIWGALLPPERRDGRRSPAETACAGFLIYGTVLEAAALPMAWAGASLDSFCRVFGCVLAVMTAVSLSNHLGLFLFGNRPERANRLRITGGSVVMIFMSAAAVLFVLLIPGASDSYHTIERMTTDLAHDSIGLYDPLTNEPLVALRPTEMIVRFHTGSEFWCRLFGIAPLTQERLVQPLITVLLSLMAVYRLFFRVFQGRRAGARTGVILAVAASFAIRALSGESGLFDGCAWSGETIFALTVIPSVILTAAEYAAGEGETRNLLLLFFASVTSVSLCSLGIWLFPAVLLASMIPAAAASKRPRAAAGMLAALIVPAAALLIYVILPEIPVA